MNDFGATITADYILDSAARRGKTGATPWLDVGCGDGLIARAIEQNGIRIVAFDGNAESVASAKANGVDAVHALLKDFNHEPVEVVYVSRALHHMPPLAESVQKLASLLRTDGILIIEEFDRALFDNRAASWLAQGLEKIKEAGPIFGTRHHWLTHGQSVDEIGDKWRHHHSGKHLILDGKEMQAGLETTFTRLENATCPFLFRYLSDLLPDTAGSTVAKFFKEEADLIEAGNLPPMGIRTVWAKKSGED